METTETTSSVEKLLDAVEHGASIVENAPHEIAHGHGPFYSTPEFWVGVSFVLVILLLSKPVGKLLKSMLHKRIDNIKKRITDANTLKTDAQKLLAEYEKKLSTASNEAKNILKKTENQIALIKKEGIEKLEAQAKIKEREASSRIDSSKKAASEEIIKLTTTLSINAAKIAISQTADNKAQDKLINDSIDYLSKL